MGQSLTVIAQTLRDADKKVQLIYALMALVILVSEYKQLIAQKNLNRIYVIKSRINTSTTEQNVTV